MQICPRLHQHVLYYNMVDLHVNVTFLWLLQYTALWRHTSLEFSEAVIVLRLHRLLYTFCIHKIVYMYIYHLWSVYCTWLICQGWMHVKYCCRLVNFQSHLKSIKYSISIYPKSRKSVCITKQGQGWLHARSRV